MVDPNKSKNCRTNSKPFLKWAGGKTHLIKDIYSYLPKNIIESKNITYVEPFVGSGAILFWFLQAFPTTKKAIINDINTDLNKAYNIIKCEPEKLIALLSELQTKYYSLKSEDDRKKFFLLQRENFNTQTLNELHNTTLLIFLNKTCFNGLYRVNKSGTFNVPFGRYNKPNICNAEKIRHANQLLQKAIILNVDYAEIVNYVDTSSAFFYIDPPYKPISKSSSFNAYANKLFDDNEQLRLKEFCTKIDKLGHRWLLSNSDMKNVDPKNEYFDNLYKDFNVNRIKVKRSINSIASKRGEISELLISNY
jgi:DNA adenine methylase